MLNIANCIKILILALTSSYVLCASEEIQKEGYPFRTVPSTLNYLPNTQKVDFGMVLLPDVQYLDSLKKLAHDLEQSLVGLSAGSCPAEFNKQLWELRKEKALRPVVNPHVSLAWGSCLGVDLINFIPFLQEVAGQFAPLVVPMSTSLEIDDEADIVFSSQKLSSSQVESIKAIYSTMTKKYDAHIANTFESVRALWERINNNERLSVKKWRKSGFLPVKDMGDIFNSVHLTLVYGAVANSKEREKAIQETVIPLQLSEIKLTHLGVLTFSFDRNAISREDLRFMYAIPLKGAMSLFNEKLT